MAEVEKDLTEKYGGRWLVWDDEAIPALNGAALAARYARSETGRWRVSGLLVLGDVIGAETLRAVPLAALENSANMSDEQAKLDAITALPALRRDSVESPEDFSRLFAEHYRAWAELVPHPVAAMARQYDVKVPTLRTWLREARLRGYLPPGRKGGGSGD